jgi:biopolymer transport protein ExbB/TolQ
MKHKVITLVAVAALLVTIPACTSQEVERARDEIRQIETDLQRENRLLQEIDEVLDDPTLADSELAQKARDAKPVVEREIERIEAMLARMEQNLDNLELTEGASVSNGLQSFGVILSSVAPMLGPYGAVALGVGGIAGAVGRSLDGVRVLTKLSKSLRMPMSLSLSPKIVTNSRNC